MAINIKDFFNITHYEYGEAYFGSYDGMRYRLAREPLENVHFIPVDKRGDARLMATVWPEPFAYARTDSKLMISEYFEISEDGMQKAVDWFNLQYEKRKNDWDQKKEN